MDSLEGLLKDAEVDTSDFKVVQGWEDKQAGVATKGVWVVLRRNDTKKSFALLCKNQLAAIGDCTSYDGDGVIHWWEGFEKHSHWYASQILLGEVKGLRVEDAVVGY